MENRTKLAMDSYDLCSICLDVFCQNNPATVTRCKHEFHLGCILEWYKTGSDCPICSQRISLEDSASQKMLEGIERNRGRKELNIAPRRANEDSSTSRLEPGEKSRTDAPSSKKQRTETRKTCAFETDDDDFVNDEAMKELPAYIASAVDTMNKSVGARKAARLREKSDDDILKSTVSHLMKTTVLMVEHADRMVYLNKASRKTMEELDVAREEIADLLREKAKMREELDAAQIEIDSHCRESVNAFQRARRARQASIRLKAELQMLKGLGAKGEKRKVYSVAKEAETSGAYNSFKQTEEFEIMKDELYMEGAHALLDKIKEERPKWDLSFLEEGD